MIGKHAPSHLARYAPSGKGKVLPNLEILPGTNAAPDRGIYQGDARQLARLLPERSIDLLLWDPDYGVGVDYGGGLVGRDEAVEFVADMLRILKPKSKTGQAVVFWSGSVERVKALLTADLCWPIYYMGIWHKPNGAGPTGNRLARRFETWIWLKDGPKPRAEWNALPDVLTENRVVPGHHEAVAHPSQKPVLLLRRLIKFFTQPGGLVVDPTLGSGSAAVAALMEGRQYIGFERNPDYVAMCKERTLAAQPPLFVASEQLDLFAA